MERWMSERLSYWLGYPVSPEIIKYILSLKTPEAAEEYFAKILDFSVPQQRTFANDCKMRLFNSKPVPDLSSSTATASSNGATKRKIVVQVPKVKKDATVLVKKDATVLVKREATVAIKKENTVNGSQTQIEGLKKELVKARL